MAFLGRCVSTLFGQSGLWSDRGKEGSGGTNQMAGDVIARMTLLMGGKSERASALCHHTGNL